MQLLRNAFDIIEAVDTDDQFDALVFFSKLLDALLHPGSLQPLGELFRVDTDRECSYCDNLTGILYGIGRRDESEDSIAAREEVPGVVVCVEANQV